MRVPSFLHERGRIREPADGVVDEHGVAAIQEEFDYRALRVPIIRRLERTWLALIPTIVARRMPSTVVPYSPSLLIEMRAVLRVCGSLFIAFSSTFVQGPTG